MFSKRAILPLSAHGQIAGGSGYHADFVGFFQVFGRFDVLALRHEDDLGDFVVGVGEVHRLFALVGDGYGGGEDVHVAVAQRGKQAVPRLVFEFHPEAARFGHGVYQIHIKALHVVVGVHEFKGGEFGVGGNAVNLAFLRRGGGGRGGVAGLVLLSAAGGEEGGGGSGGNPLFDVHVLSFNHARCGAERLF